MSKRSPLFALTLVNAVLVIVASYALLRLFDVCFKHEPNPATVIWSAHIAMFWRIGIGTYAAAIASPMIWLFARRDIDRALNVTLHATMFVAVLLGVQGLAFP